MGDTVGDLPILNLARRPIAFNPSFTLANEMIRDATIVIANKDLVTVSNFDEASGLRRAHLWHCSLAEEVLDLVKAR